MDRTSIHACSHGSKTEGTVNEIKSNVKDMKAWLLAKKQLPTPVPLALAGAQSRHRVTPVKVRVIAEAHFDSKGK